jgi:hypothetical protein
MELFTLEVNLQHGPYTKKLPNVFPIHGGLKRKDALS